MKIIDISTKKYPNAVAIVDDEDFEDICRFKWCRMASGYAVRNMPRVGGRRQMEYMHRRVTGNQAGIVDHANMNRLDNRKENLRVTGSQGNTANANGRSRSGFKGVTAHPGGFWRARIMVNYEQVCLGLFRDPEDAHAAYVKAAKKYFGEFARVDMR
jgi:hypothetical protein